MRLIEEHIVSPLSNRIANSILNPYVLSYSIWTHSKRLAPQRAVELARIASATVSNSLRIYNSEKTAKLREHSGHLQHQVLQALLSKQGRDLVVDIVALVHKIAQALNTPESRNASRQIFRTVQLLIEFLSTSEGRRIVETASICANSLFDVAATEETAVFLVELATNICHIVDAEALRQHNDSKDNSDPAKQTEKEEADSVDIGQEKSTEKAERLSVEEVTSEKSKQYPKLVPVNIQPDITSEVHSAQIEKDVLLKMGLGSDLIADIQSILDKKSQILSGEPLIQDQEIDYVDSANSGSGEIADEMEISPAFGTKISENEVSKLGTLEDNQMNEENERSIKQESDAFPSPEWHDDVVRAAIRRYKLRVADAIEHRKIAGVMKEKLAASLKKRQDMDPLDHMVCMVMSRFIVYSFGALFFVYCFRHAFAIYV
uniref:Uncharacterized protein AlNc14C88G5583 n=1 Tax=Albugo laibachii Nc14 TaxID=890382 RepID=F0WG53_9STRA|nr:conserved hypothetical protein [Albugo laibachii Nc14]|eukprot:CCA20188.1 conserved hypothetical protein [Albugo laibachii Nc14]